MTDQELDKLMQRILLDAIKRECASEGSEVAVFEPTPKYQRQMRAMLANPIGWARKRARPVWKKVLQRAAMILLVFSLSFGSLMAASPTVRATVIRWVTEWYDSHVTYRYSGEVDTEEMPQYELTALPEGYVEDVSKRIEWPQDVSFTYRNPNQKNDLGIIFTYSYMSQGGAVDFITDNVNVIDVTVRGLEGQLFLQEDWENTRSTLTWIDPKCNLQFSIDAALNKEDILHIAESITLVKKTR